MYVCTYVCARVGLGFRIWRLRVYGFGVQDGSGMRARLGDSGCEGSKAAECKGARQVRILMFGGGAA